MERIHFKRLMPGVYYGSNRRGFIGGWLMLIKLGRYGLNVGSGFTGSISLRSWEWARYDFADHFSFDFTPGGLLANWHVYPEGGN